MIEKSTEFNESVFVLYHSLNSIYQNFDGRFPKEVDKKINELIQQLINYMDKDIDEEDEIIDIKYYRTLLLKENSNSDKK